MIGGLDGGSEGEGGLERYSRGGDCDNDIGKIQRRKALKWLRVLKGLGGTSLGQDCLSGLRRFDLWMESFDVHLEIGDE
ncbi:hypothetical protein Tco_0161968 [Tanacetum coccineum]